MALALQIKRMSHTKNIQIIFNFGRGVDVLPYPGIHSPGTPNYEQAPAPSPHSFLNKKVYG